MLFQIWLSKFRNDFYSDISMPSIYQSSHVVIVAGAYTWLCFNVDLALLLDIRHWDDGTLQRGRIHYIPDRLILDSHWGRRLNLESANSAEALDSAAGACRGGGGGGLLQQVASVSAQTAPLSRVSLCVDKTKASHLCGGNKSERIFTNSQGRGWRRARGYQGGPLIRALPTASSETDNSPGLM